MHPEVIERYYVEDNERRPADVRGPFPSIKLAREALDLAPPGGSYVIKCYAYKLIDDYVVEEG